MSTTPLTRRVDQAVRDHGGKCTVADITKATGAKAADVHVAIRHLGFVKVRPEGAGYFDPAIVYHPDMPPYRRDRVEPNVDIWLRGLFADGTDHRESSWIYTRGRDAGYSRISIESALRRLRCVAVKIGGAWARQAPGTDRAPIAADLSDPTQQRIVFAVLDQLTTPLPPADVTTLALDQLGVDPTHPAVETTYNPTVSAMWDNGYLAATGADGMVARGPASFALGFAPSAEPTGVES